jgi:NAD(P)-dependent dehydrogenase (short-subunit alcohol dehydrogenase family)
LRFEGKIAIVTGGGGGIGREICISLANEGASVIVTDVDLSKAKETAEIILKNDQVALSTKMDVTLSSDINRVVNDVVRRFNGINILVNNAGVSTMSRVVDMKEEEWDFNMDVNAKGVFLCSKAVAKEMIRFGKGGKIVNIASMAGKTGAPYLAHYCASKFAVIGFTQSLALELAKHNINVNAICPGYVETQMQKRELVWESQLEKTTLETIKARYIETTPLGRLEQPKDVAKIVLFLCEPASEFMTGQAINVTGGIEMH